MEFYEADLQRVTPAGACLVAAAIDSTDPAWLRRVLPHLGGRPEAASESDLRNLATHLSRTTHPDRWYRSKIGRGRGLHCDVCGASLLDGPVWANDVSGFRCPSSAACAPDPSDRVWSWGTGEDALAEIHSDLLQAGVLIPSPEDLGLDRERLGDSDSLQAAREARGWSLERLAEECGVPVSILGALESGAGPDGALAVVTDTVSRSLGVEPHLVQEWLRADDLPHSLEM